MDGFCPTLWFPAYAGMTGTVQNDGGVVPGRVDSRMRGNDGEGRVE